MSCDSMDSNSDCYAYSASRNPSDVHKNQNSELEVGQVRWFYRDACDKRWLPFNGCDSINLELSYRSLLACNMTNTLGSCGHFTNRTGECSSNPEVPVRGGLFVAKVVQRCCFPIYWSGDKCPILRGTWFRECYNDNLEPLDDESMVERLEVEYTTRHLKTCNSLKSLRKSFYSSGNLFSKSDSGSPFQSVASAPVFQCSDVGETIGESPTQTSESLCEDFPIESESHLNDSSNTPSVLKKRIPYQTIHFTDCHVDWYGENELYLYYESTSLYIRQKLGMQKVGTRLFRGFNELAQVEDRVPDISHLCFVIHGIGQKMGRNPILRNCNELRVTCEKIKARFFPHLDEQNKRVEFLPIEWRTSLQLDGDTVESITPVHVQGLRTVLNSSAMDIMYYTSPLYRTEIISSLKSELNRLYDMFRRLNPDFESRGGKVSIIAHSLGCVLIYDLITGWNQLLDNDQLTEILLDKSTHGRNISFNTDSSKSSENVDKHVSTNNTDEEVYHDCRADMISTSGNLEQITRVSFQLDAARTLVNNLEQELNSLIVADEHPMSNSLHKSNIDNQSASDTSMPCINSSLSQPNTLLFANNLENFFCLGSPLGVYLVLRGIRPGPFQTQDTILPRKICPRIFNIYHPADPVAYRLEPLILKYYSNIQPVMIHRTDAVSKPCYDSLPLIAYSGKELKHPKSQDYFQQPVKNASDTNHLTVQDGCTDSSRRFSIASRLFGFFSRTASSPTHENDVIDFSLSENTYDHTPLKTTFELFSDDEEKPYSMPNHSNSCKSTDKNESNISLSNPSCNDPVENGFYLESLQLEHRLDFELRASRYENLYISLLTSHTNYWSNTDICMFIMTYLFPQSPGSSN